ncbi:hypothetical protein BJX63DRAFT_241233 [Aspergillus granulosus]|uniref:Uncharacterized protein n=1 Tax=Aspergillus granulosus TaxID=176169 RepID=A0ABR4HB71_9EURO
MPRSRTGTTHAGVQGWFTSSTSHPTLHSAMLFGSYSHRRTRWVMKRQGHFSYEDMRQMTLCEANVIAQMNAIVRDPTQAVSDPVILVVLCLATNKYDGPSDDQRSSSSPFYAPLRSLQWLDIYGRLSPHPVHQAGLLQLIALRGGLEKIELPGLAAVISFSNILGASKSLSRPNLPFISLQTGRQMTLQQMLESNSSPTIISDRRDPLLDIHITTQMYDTFRAMRAYVSLVEVYQDGADGGVDTLTMCDIRNLVQWHVMALEPASELGPWLLQCPVYEACRLALMIFGVGVTFPLPPGVALFSKLASTMRVELQAALEQRSVLENTRSIQACCWCLVLGGIVAEPHEEKQWFVQELRRTLAVLKISTWDQLKRVLRSFLWLDSACDVGGRQLWVEIDALLVVARYRSDCPSQILL